jgi:CubicO group peptidase (beta-lactamase class C family)
MSIHIVACTVAIGLIAQFGDSAHGAPSSTASATDCGIPTVIDDGWKIAPPASVKLDTHPLCQWINRYLADPKENVHSIVVVRHGALVFERYFSGNDQLWGVGLGNVSYGPSQLHDVRGITASVTSLLVGIALDQKKIKSLDQPVFDFVPEYADLRTPEKERIRVRDLLTMSSGIAWDETTKPYSDTQNSEIQMNRAADPYRYVLEQPVAAPPGTKYNYSGGSTALLAAIIRKTTGRQIDDFADAALFQPLGIKDFQWVKLVNGDPSASSALRLRPRDLAKIGQLVLSHGNWNGHQIVSANYITQSTKSMFSAGGLYYSGYQWFIGRSLVNGREVDWTVARGLGGQRLFVAPSLDLVVVTTAGLYNNPLDGRLPLEIFNDYVLPAFARN